jgi:type VI secretion system protein VasD
MNTGMTARMCASLMARLAALCLASCASAPAVEHEISPNDSAPQGGVIGMLGTVADKAMEIAGLKAPVKPDVLPDSALPDRRIRWLLHASSSLNVAENGQPLALVTRIYRLRNPDSFLQAQMEVFGDPVREKQALGDDLISAREVLLLPGQHHEATDKIPREVPYLGIVALYRHPAGGRWRFAFKALDAEISGLSLGAHACALSVQKGEPIGQTTAYARSTAITCD